MAFKGTPTIGSKNYPEERKALDAVEAVYDRLDAERNLGVRSNAAKVKALEAELSGRHRKGEQLRRLGGLHANHRGERRRGTQRRYG